MKEFEVELVLWDWIITKSLLVKHQNQIYFNRINKLNSPIFNTSGINQKPDFIISFNKGFGTEYAAIEIKPSEKSKDIHDSGKILGYYENYITNKTRYFIENNEIKINHFGVATENSPNGKLFKDDELLITNTNSSDEWRKTNSKLNLIPEFEYQRTSDFLRRLWAEWRNLKKRIKLNEDLPSIGIIISNPNKDNNPYFFTMIYVKWLNKNSWKQRFWRL